MTATPSAAAPRSFSLQAGCKVLLAEDGFDALAKIADNEPDLIFCDILMPRLDGYQTCALIKKNPRFHEIPVIMLSSKDGLFDRARGPHGRLRAIPDQAVHQGGLAGRGGDACRNGRMKAAR
jgi:CheY-like chemotaxis protein